ncbi:capsid assembly scaffolding protein Gp46 family protein [Konateibacter massiliensis]|uniref:capsid assembly scaffolding protein Gp46 family protein n=1 Tax=Konateibacter massiliensis TaxID=2002841 RepID=UPI000C149DCF|nr:DUF4355 domain-containing protein [Konateibacter massiliensis]
MELNIEGLSQEQMEQVTKLVQSETDKVRTDYSTKLRTANDELAKYKPAEKSKTEKALEERLSALEAKEKEIANKERAMTIADKLKEKNLPSELAQYLNVGDNVDEVIEKVGTTIGSYFLENGNRPTNHNTNKGITKADFAKMSYGERAKLFQENTELYKALSK